MENIKRLAIIGGGPAGLFMLKRLVETDEKNYGITIFERKEMLGAGMPYSAEGANKEHITNVSGNEIPPLVTSVEEWMQTVPEALSDYNINAATFNEYKVLPRLLFGKYLEAQFNLLLQKAKHAGIDVVVYTNTVVEDIVDKPADNKTIVVTGNHKHFEFDHVIICSGHNWPCRHERKIAGYYDSPYPPAKLAFTANHAVAIRGSSLTAIDAIRTLSRYNGSFYRDKANNLSYKKAGSSGHFKIMMYSTHGLLPAVRFHLHDSHLSDDPILTSEEIEANRKINDGFLSLDYVFEKNFKEPLFKKDPAFYEKIKGMRLEAFTEMMMNIREHIEPFQLLKAEYAEAEKSIKRKESVYWKEILAELSFAMNYPAKYFSAEDMLRLKKILKPLISVVIAFVPQSSVEEMMALHDAGILNITAVSSESYVEPGDTSGATYYIVDELNKKQSIHYKTYVDCVGQPALSWKQLPFKSLVENKTVSAAKLKFHSAEAAAEELKNGNEDVVKDANENYYLHVAGVAINDSFQAVDDYGAYNERIFIMAVPYIGGYNPDYSGLDFGEEASARIMKALQRSHEAINM